MNKSVVLFLTSIFILSISPTMLWASENTTDIRKTTWQDILSDVVGHYPLPSDLTGNDNKEQKSKLDMPKMIIDTMKSGARKTSSSTAGIAESKKSAEVDSIIASIITLARKAKRDNQKLIIGLETDWIPGYNKKTSLQYQALSPLIKEIDSLGENLRSLGLDNVEIVHENSAQLAAAVSDRADKTHAKLSNIVILASNKTINSSEFSQLRDTSQKEKPFFAAIDSAELERWDIENKGSLKQLDIKLMEMLLLALELAVGKEPPNTPLIVSYDKEKRLVVFLPKALPVDYEELKQNYNAQKLALQAA